MTILHRKEGAIADVRDGSRTGRLLEYSAVIALLLLFGLFLAHKQDLSIADIGRHIRNGEFVFKDRQVLWTNFYSYTEPNFYVVNHHWGTGVLFYLVWRVIGFAGLHVFYAALYLIAFGTFFMIAKKQSGLFAAGFSALLIIPLLALRTEIRPEVLTYIFSGLFLWLLTEWRAESISFRRLLILLPMLEVFWVNTHIYFITGLIIIGVYWVDSILFHRENARKLTLLLVLATLVTVINPFGLDGALAPFTIFQNFGISVTENDPVWVIDRFNGFFTYDTLYFKIVSLLLVISFLVAARKEPRKIPFPYLLFAAGFSAMAWFSIRNIPLFALFTVPVLASNTVSSFSCVRERWGRYVAPSMFLLLIVAGVLFSTNKLSAVFRLNPETGFGMATGNSDAADFIRKNRLQGPVFNNFDAGGYLIYHLFPNERIFVDNRPEAYPAAFFEQMYSPMRYSEEKWREVDARFGFKTIVLARRADKGMVLFVNARMGDPQWLRVFDDPFFLVFVRR